MTREEAIKYLKQLYPNGGYTWLDEQRMEAITMAIEALSMASSPSNLEEATEELEEYAQRESELFGEREYEVDSLDRNALRKGFYWGCKAGAEWMASQGASFEDVIEMCYCNKKPMGLSGYDITFTNEIQALMQSHGIGDGDTVIIQIRKK